MEKSKHVKSPGYIGPKRLLADLPEWWLDVIEECLYAADAAQRFNGEFPGARVWRALREKNKHPFPNLKPLVTYGILEKTESSRGGRRAYYAMPDRDGVRRALADLKSGL